MTDTKRLIKQAGLRAPTPEFTLEDVRRARERALRTKRLTSGAVGSIVALGVLALSVAAIGPLGGHGGGRVAQAQGGTGLPPATRSLVTVGPNQYTYQHLVLESSCRGQADAYTTVGIVDGVEIGRAHV